MPDFRADLLAGIVVGIVALPLSMALAIAVGVPPQHGLYTAIVAGVVVALTGGSKFQVTGPTAAFVVILAPIVTKYGLAGLLIAGLMAGVLLIGMGAARLGKLIQFIPHPVTTGFTAGIAVVIATLQLKDALGLPIARWPESYVEKLIAIAEAIPHLSFAEVAVTAVSFPLLFVLPRYIKRIPPPLIVMVLVSGGVLLVHRFVPSFQPATIGSRFQSVIDGHVVLGIPPRPPTLVVPWGQGGLTFAQVRELFPSAFAIAMLGAIESLLSAVIADGLTGKRHDPNAELVGLGIGNIVVPFFGGIAATGALARTATNIRAGGRSPFSSVIHAIFVLLAMVLLAPLVAYIPMAALASLLLVVAWNMSDVRHFWHIVRVAPRSDVLVLVACFLLTVIFDMVVAVTAGVVMAALLFMRRMADLTHARAVLERGTGETDRELPANVALYEIAGPLFFGAAEKAMGALDSVDNNTRVVIIDLSRVPTIDATGLVGLESALRKLTASKRHIILLGPLPEPRNVWERTEFSQHVRVVDTTERAIALATELLGSEESSARTSVPTPQP
jgi:SulP family sulfate permease